VRIGLLGPLELDGGAQLEPRDRIALSVLAVRHGRAVAPDVLADALWSGSPPSTWRKQVQICVARLRRALGASAIETLAGGYRLALDDDELDTVRFERLGERGRAFAATGDATRAASAYARALELWRGHPFEELDGWPSGHSEAARLEELRRTLEEDLLDARLDAGDHRRVAVQAEALVAEQPWRERRWAILALARYRCGRQAEALESIRIARHTLAEQLGLDASPDLAALELSILRQEPGLAAPPEPATVSEACPYKGLLPYGEGDAEGFFGRSAEVAACLERLRTTSLLVLAGHSGCGKSSLLRAGLVPALQARGGVPVVLTPAPDPAAAWAAAVSSVDPAVPVVVDQFEELFVLGCGPEVLRSFLSKVVARARAGRVVIAVRSDHLGSFALDEAFSRLAERGLYLVSPLAGDALREAIEQPALRAGLRVEPGLVDVLARDSEGEPGALPLLSHALVETWKRRDGSVLTVEGYRDSGGIRGAVARSADRLYDNLGPEQRSIVRSILLRLVAPSLDGDPVRRRVAGRVLLGDPGRERVVALLVRSRLVTAEEDTFELAHEALARAWPRLRAWLDEDAAGQRLLRHLGAAADGWDSLGRPPSELYRGARLDAALEWREAARPDLTPLEQTFLDASVERAASETRALQARARRDRRQNRRLRALLATAAVLTAAAAAAGFVAFVGRQEAREAQADALHEALVDRSLALRGTNRSVAALLAVEAYRRRPGARAWSALLGTFTADPTFMGHRYLPAEHLEGVVIPGTTAAIVALDGRRLRHLDLTSGTLDHRYPPAAADAEPDSVLRASDDGRFVAQLIATANRGGCSDLARLRATDNRGCAAFSVYEIATGRRVLGPVVPPFGPGDIAINADGSRVAVAGGFNGDVAVYRTADGRRTGVRAGLARPKDIDSGNSLRDTAAVDFGPDGHLYLGSLAGPIRELAPTRLDVLRTFPAPPLSSQNHVVASGDLLIAGGSDALVAFDLRSGSKRWTADLRGVHPDPCPWLTVAASSKRLYCGNHFGVIEERYLSTGARTGVDRSPQLGAVGDLSVTTDGRELVAFGAETPAVSRWRLDGSGPVTDLVAERHVVFDGYDATGRTLLVARRVPTATTDADFSDYALWDPSADRTRGRFPRASGMGWIGADTLLGFSPATERLEYFDAATRQVTGGTRIPPSADRILASAAGTRYYALLKDGTVWTLDAATRRRIGPTIRVQGTPGWVSATRGGRRVVVTAFGASGPVTTVHDGATGERLAGPLRGPGQTSVSLDGVLVGATAGEITEYDLDTLRPIASFPGARGEVNTLQFSADSKTLLATSLDQTVSIYDVATRTRIGDPIVAGAPFVYPGFLRPDGNAAAITVRNGIAIWDIDPKHLAEAACALADRNLTRTEWQTYIGKLGVFRKTCPRTTTSP
jgi:DNA-binding SARP family transcriptional activator/WD40 repeat protein